MTAAVTNAVAPWHARLHGATLAHKTGAVLLGTAVLAASSYVSVPLQPVPMTLQTLAVTMVGAVYGWQLGAITVLAWLLEAAVGLPVLSAGATGLARFSGPTGGYLIAFAVAAALTGWMSDRSAHRVGVWRNVAAMLAGNALCLAIGGAWLWVSVGPRQAWLLGVAPFVLGGVLKSVLGAALLKAYALGMPGRPGA